MDEKTLKQMTREYEQEMPEEILKMINEFDWKRELRGIVRENNLMLDVGTDLEESVYLMLLGAVKVEDVYDRMIDTHELPDDRVQKVLHEIELKIFNPLAKKITGIEGYEDSPEDEKAGSVVLSGAETEHSRDSILAEIENDELDARPIPNNIVMPGNRTIPGTSMEKTTATPIVTGAASMPMSDTANPVAIKSTPVGMPTAPATAATPSPIQSSDRLGLRGDATPSMPLAPRSFSLSQEPVITVDEPTIAPVRVEGIQQDPIAAGLTKFVSMATPALQAAPKTYAADPYREPIE